MRASSPPRVRTEVNSDPVLAARKSREFVKQRTYLLVIARSQRVRPEVAGPMTGSATKQSSEPSGRTGLLRFARKDENKGKRNAGKRTVVSPAPNGCGRATDKAACAALSALGRARLRSTTALAKGCVVPWCGPGQVSWANRPSGGGHSADGLTTSSDAPRTPVVMPADMMPGPPGSRADEAWPAGTALAPAARHHPDGVPWGEI